MNLKIKIKFDKLEWVHIPHAVMIVQLKNGMQTMKGTYTCSMWVGSSSMIWKKEQSKRRMTILWSRKSFSSYSMSPRKSTSTGNNSWKRRKVKRKTKKGIRLSRTNLAWIKLNSTRLDVAGRVGRRKSTRMLTLTSISESATLSRLHSRLSSSYLTTFTSYPLHTSRKPRASLKTNNLTNFARAMIIRRRKFKILTTSLKTFSSGLQTRGSKHKRKRKKR